MEFIITIVLALVVLALIIFPSFRKKLHVMCSGFLNIFIEDKAKTPEGAAAVFSEAIEEYQEKYNKASDTLSKLTGEQHKIEETLANLKKKLETTEKKCESFVKAGDMSNARLFATERESLVTGVAQYEGALTRICGMVDDAKSIFDSCEKNLRDMKAQKITIIEKMKLDKQIKEMTDSMDNLRRDSATSKLLEAVKEGADDLSKTAIGSREVHNSRLSTRLEKADQKAAGLATDSYLEELAKKYNK